MTKLAPEWVQTSDPVIRSPARYRWTTGARLGTILGKPKYNKSYKPVFEKMVLKPKISNFDLQKTTLREIQPNPPYDMLFMSSQRSVMQKKKKLLNSF